MNTKEKNQNDKKMLKQEIYLELFNKKNQGMSKKLYQEAMYDLIYPTLKNYVNNNRNKYSNLTDEECEDLIMDVFVSCIEKDYQRTEPNNYTALISKAEANLKKLLEKNNSKKSKISDDIIIYSSLEDTIDQSNPLENVIKDENSREILAYLDKLTRRQATIIKQRYFDNLTYDNIGKNLKMFGSQVQVIERKALERLKKAINTDKKEMLKRQFVHDMQESYDKKILVLKVLDRCSILKIADTMSLSTEQVRKILEKYSAAMKNYVQENTIN